MPLNHNDWKQIQRYVEGRIADQGEYFTQDVVVKSDNVNKIVWVKKFGDIPIPLFTFDIVVKYYIVDGSGNTVPRTTDVHKREVEIVTPAVGDVVLIARLLGSGSLPRCIGVLKSANFIGGE